MEQAITWLDENCGIEIMRKSHMRTYLAHVKGSDIIQPVFLSASEIPSAFLDGKTDFGITGMDMVQEKIPQWQRRIEAVGALDFGYADLLTAVPTFWQDVRSMHDLDAVAHEFRSKHGFRLRIATKYHFLARRFLKARGVADYKLVDSQGATEGTVRNNIAEAIIDISSTGQTLQENGLKKLSDGMLLKSQAYFFARKDFCGDKNKYDSFCNLIKTVLTK